MADVSAVDKLWKRIYPSSPEAAMNLALVIDDVYAMGWPGGRVQRTSVVQILMQRLIDERVRHALDGQALTPTGNRQTE